MLKLTLSKLGRRLCGAGGKEREEGCAGGVLCMLLLTLSRLGRRLSGGKERGGVLCMLLFTLSKLGRRLSGGKEWGEYCACSYLHCLSWVGGCPGGRSGGRAAPAPASPPPCTPSTRSRLLNQWQNP
jgi:hypothetical protein